MANSQKKIAMLAGNGDGVNSRPKYSAFKAFIARHADQIDVILIVTVWLLVALFSIAGGQL